MTAKAPSIANIRTLLRSGDSQRAERDARQLLAASPQNSELLYLLGCARLERGALDEAIALFERASAGAPAQAELLEAMASALLRRGDLDGAERHALLAQQSESTRSRPVNLLGLVALERGDIETALQTFARAVSLEIPNLEATTNMAVALNRSGDWRGAEEWSRSALKIAPNHLAALINLGLALKAQRRLAEAREAFRRAGTDPRARFNLGYTQMLEGNLADGLPLLEARKPLLGIGRGLDKREWNGMAAPRKTLLVVHEQGLGDTLMMCRFWPQLQERFEHVVALVQPPLARLMAASFPGVEVVTSLEGVRYDLWCATMSLPWLLGVDAVDKIPRKPWINVAAAGIAAEAAAEAPVDTSPRDERLRIGINWAGNPKFAFDAVRSTHLDQIALLLQAPGIEWVSLHRGHLEHEAEAMGLPQPLQQCEDFLDTARVIRGLDLVISTETAIPNLSAAMGVPTCVLASPDWDWRWAHWYPNITVCAQERPGEWMSACVAALEAIREEMLRREGQAA